MIILAHTFRIIATIFCIIADKTNDKNTLLLCNGIYNFFNGLHYLLLNAITGAICSFITIIRNILFYVYKKKVPLIFIILYFILIIMINIKSIDSLITFIPIPLVIIYTTAIYVGEPYKLKIAIIITCILEIIYDYVFLSYIGIIVCIIDIILVALSFKTLKKS